MINIKFNITLFLRRHLYDTNQIIKEKIQNEIVTKLDDEIFDLVTEIIEDSTITVNL